MGTIPIEIVALSLRGLSPTTVTFNGGQNPQPWDVEVDLSPTGNTPLGSMTATKTHANGGTFDASFFIVPRFRFTQIDPPGLVRVFDFDTRGIAPFQLDISGASFVHKVNPALGVIVQPGAIFVPGVVEVIPGDQNSQVQLPFAGIDPLGGVLHTVCAPKGLAPGACCFDNGTCQDVADEATCIALGGTFQGHRTSCTPNPCPQPTGACCFVGGTCTVETLSDCNTLGGSYQGDGSNCSPNNCPAPSPADITGPASNAPRSNASTQPSGTPRGPEMSGPLRASQTSATPLPL